MSLGLNSTGHHSQAGCNVRNSVSLGQRCLREQSIGKLIKFRLHCLQLRLKFTLFVQAISLLRGAALGRFMPLFATIVAQAFKLTGGLLWRFLGLQLLLLSLRLVHWLFAISPGSYLRLPCGEDSCLEIQEIGPEHVGLQRCRQSSHKLYGSHVLWHQWA